MKISTPGRICLFGEHQDYLGLPVIAAAISRRIGIDAQPRTDDDQIIIHQPDIAHKEVFNLWETLPYGKKRDYFKSTVNVLKKRGFAFSHGLECTVRGNIPINSGTSSSSALIVTWVHILVKHCDNPRAVSAKELGEIAHDAEVLEFGEPGGMMDHYSTAIGNVIYLESIPQIYVQALQPQLGTFVLGDSLQPKDTLGILARCRYGMEHILQKISAFDANFSLFSTPATQTNDYRRLLTKDEFELFNANVADRDILRAGKKLLQNHLVDEAQFGKLLYQHFENLRDYKRTSTPKINRMIEAALAAGALGGKINGSGGGGCMFVYAPNQPQRVAEAIERAGGKAYIVQIDEGTKIEL